MSSYFYLFWQMRWYMYNYWRTMGMPQTKEAWTKVAEYWGGVWKAYLEHAANVAKAYTEWAKKATDAFHAATTPPKATGQ